MAGFRLVASLMNDPCAAGNGRSAAALRHVAAGHKMILRADNVADWLSAKVVLRLAKQICPLTAPERSGASKSRRTPAS